MSHDCFFLEQPLLLHLLEIFIGKALRVTARLLLTIGGYGILIFFSALVGIFQVLTSKTCGRGPPAPLLSEISITMGYLRRQIELFGFNHLIFQVYRVYKYLK